MAIISFIVQALVTATVLFHTSPCSALALATLINAVQLQTNQFLIASLAQGSQGN
jgi:hypothetical protein